MPLVVAGGDERVGMGVVDRKVNAVYDARQLGGAGGEYALKPLAEVGGFDLLGVASSITIKRIGETGVASLEEILDVLRNQ